MTKAYLALGSNEDDRQKNIKAGLKGIASLCNQRIKSSPVYENPAVLPKGAPEDWNRPYFNMVVEVETDLSLNDFFIGLRRVEIQCGREERPRWAPRTLDIDLLLWGNEIIDQENLKVPHPRITERAFVLDPLSHLAPSLRIPGHDQESVLSLALRHPHHMPLWMGIINVTPDSFSSTFKGFEGTSDTALRVQEMIGSGAHIIDLGAESTRPGATPISASEEWARLEPVLQSLTFTRTQPLSPLISIDTRHAEVAEKALKWGAHMINDVGGLQNQDMIGLAKTSSKDFVAMHNLGLPADENKVLPIGTDPVEHISQWLEERLENWDKQGLDLSRIIFDPGVGFGKTSFQSLKIMQNLDRFHQYGLRLLLGHSRKSFMNPFSTDPPILRDWETIGASLHLSRMGTHILRVHNPGAHVKAFRAWSHLQKGLN